MSAEQNSPTVGTFQKPNINVEEFSKTTTDAEKLKKKMQEMPIFPIGIAGTTLAVVYGVYNFKNRGTMSASVYLTKLRVKAQGVVVGVLTLSVLGSMFNQYVMKKN